MGGLFSVNVTFTILAVACRGSPTTSAPPRNTMTWVITGPLLAFGVAAPDARQGRATSTAPSGSTNSACCSSLFAAGLSALAWDECSLIVIRTIGSLEGAATGAASMAIVMRTFGREERVKAMGWWSLVGAGGPVHRRRARRLPVGVVRLARDLRRADSADRRSRSSSGRIVLPETDTLPPQKFDIAGAVTLSVGHHRAALRASTVGRRWAGAARCVVGSFVLCPMLLCAVRARRATHRRAADLARLPEEAAPSSFPVASQALANFAYMGGFILTPSLLQTVYDYSDEKIGLLVIARPLTFSMLSPSPATSR